MCVLIEGEITVRGVHDKLVIAGKVDMTVRGNYD